MKECTKCGESKELTEFAFRKERGTYRTQCNSCRFKMKKASILKRRSKEEEAARTREYQLITKYGITGAEYEEMLEAQENCCDICGIHQDHVRHKRLYVDHNHDTGAVRALLCNMCNVGLGHFKDSIQFLENATNYLKRFK